MAEGYNQIDYKYSEDEVLERLKSYIDATYNQHYSQGSFQATEIIWDSGHGEGFCAGNIIKYAMRYGKKGDNLGDLLKIMHYAIILYSRCVDDWEEREWEQ